MCPTVTPSQAHGPTRKRGSVLREFESLAEDDRKHFYLYVDNCCQIGDTLRDKIPQLNTLPTAQKVYKLPRSVTTVVVKSHAEAMQLLEKLMVDAEAELEVGFDMEWSRRVDKLTLILTLCQTTPLNLHYFANLSKHTVS